MTPRQIAAVLTLRELGIEPKLAVFKDRLVVQKTIYLAQAAGVDLGYFYGWYLRGPYCSPLARDLFAALEDPQGADEVVERFELDDTSRKRLAALEPLIAVNQPALARRLELFASVHFLVQRKQVPDGTATAVSERLRVFGKDFEEAEVERAMDDLCEAGLLNAPES